MSDFSLENNKEFQKELLEKRKGILGEPSSTTWLYTVGGDIYSNVGEICFGAVSKTDCFQADRFFINIRGYGSSDSSGYLNWVINKSPVSDCFITKDVKEAFELGLEMNTESPRPRFFFAIYLARFALNFRLKINRLLSYGLNFPDILPMIVNFNVGEEIISAYSAGSSEGLPLPFTLDYKEYMMDSPKHDDSEFETMKGGFTEYPEVSSWDYWSDKDILDFCKEDETWMNHGFFNDRYRNQKDAPNYFKEEYLSKIQRTVVDPWNRKIKRIYASKENVEYILNLMKGK